MVKFPTGRRLANALGTHYCPVGGSRFSSENYLLHEGSHAGNSLPFEQWRNLLKIPARLAGFEPATYGLEVRLTPEIASFWFILCISTCFVYLVPVAESRFLAFAGIIGLVDFFMNPYIRTANDNFHFRGRFQKHFSQKRIMIRIRYRCSFIVVLTTPGCGKRRRTQRWPHNS